MFMTHSVYQIYLAFMLLLDVKQVYVVVSSGIVPPWSSNKLI